MTHNRRAARIDDAQQGIVDALNAIPGVTVALGHDDILVGYRHRTYWFELKSPHQISKRTGKPYKGRIKPSQEKLLETWQGQYDVVSTVDEILKIIGIDANASAIDGRWGFNTQGE